MDRACFLAMLFTSTLGIVLVAVGHVFVESPAETACKQLIRMLGADTPAFRSLGRLIAWCTAGAALSMVLVTASSAYLCQSGRLPRQYRKQWQTRLATCGVLVFICLQTACSGGGLASCSVVLGMSRTLLVTVQRMSMASRSAQGALLVAQQQVQRQLQQPPEGLQQLLHDAKAYMPLLPKPPEPIQHALDALADATLGKLVQPAVDSVQHVVQRQVTSALSSSATELTRNNTALAGMVAQLEMLAGDAALQEAHGEGGGACAPPCLDLRQYPVLHSQACICAAQAFSRMRVLSEQAAVLSTWAIMGWGLQLVCCIFSLAVFSHWLGGTGNCNKFLEAEAALGTATYQRLEVDATDVETGLPLTSGGHTCSKGDVKSAEVELKELNAIVSMCAVST